MKRIEALRGAAQLIVELGPAVVFMVSYNLIRADNPAGAIFIATAIFMAATALSLAVALLVQRRVPSMLLVSAVLIFAFGGLTLSLRDDLFIKLQPTILNGLFAAALLGGLALRRNVWKLLFQSIFALPDRIWDVLALRWALFYLFLAVTNEVLWRTQSEEVWVASKVYLVMPATGLFLLANLPITLKWLNKTNEDYTAARS